MILKSFCGNSFLVTFAVRGGAGINFFWLLLAQG